MRFNKLKEPTQKPWKSLLTIKDDIWQILKKLQIAKLKENSQCRNII